MKRKLSHLFHFLEKNRRYNHSVQERYYASIIRPYNNVQDKVLSLLYEIANTQSQPKIDKLAESLKGFYLNRESLESFERFAKYVNVGRSDIKHNYNSLFKGMKSQHGWGNKTAALFVKSIFHIHNDEY